MNKIFSFLFFIILTAHSSKAQEINFALLQHQVGTETRPLLVHDSNGNIIMTNGISIPNTGGSNNPSNVHIKKFNANGSLLWNTSSNNLLNGQMVEINDLAVDDQDNIYVVGSYNTSSLTIGDFTFTEPFNQNSNVFYAKLAPDGSVDWIKGIHETLMSENICIGGTIDITPSNEIIIAGGYFKDIIIGNDTLIGDPNPTSFYTPFNFYAKLSIDGEPIWAKRTNDIQAGDGHTFNAIISTAVDDDNELFFITHFDSTTILGTDTLFYNVPKIIKTDSDGNFLNAAALNSPYFIANNLVTNECGDVVLLGEFQTSLSIQDQGLIANSSRDIFVASFNNDLELNWLHQFGSTGGDLAGHLTTNTKNEIYFSFEFWGNLPIDGNSPVAGFLDDIVIKLDANGTMLWFKRSSGTGYVNCGDLSVSHDFKIVSTGRFAGNEIFDGLQVNSQPTNFPDIFIVSYKDTMVTIELIDCSPLDASLEKIEFDEDFSFYPNPASEIISIIHENTTIPIDVIITNVSGQIVARVLTEQNKIDVSGISPGLYFIQIDANNKSHSKAKRVIIQ